jgi:predicted nucleic acid-binding protein
MKTAVDTNVISAIWTGEATAKELTRLLDEARRAGSVVICGPVYAELRACPKASEQFVAAFLGRVGIDIDFDLHDAIWQETGRTFAAYAVRRRRSGGKQPARLLADFIIGSHAAFRADRLLTLDARRYRNDFPKLEMITIDQG